MNLQSKTPLMRRVNALVLLCLFTFSSCQNLFTGADTLVRESLRKANEELDASVSNLEQTIDGQRTKLAGDMQTLVEAVGANMRGLAEQANQSVTAVLSTGKSLEQSATGTLVGTIQTLTQMSRNLTNAVQTGVDATIRTAAQEFDRQRTITLQQLNAAAQDVLRPMLAQFKVVGGQLIGQAESAVSRVIFLAAGGAVLLAAVIALAIALVRRAKSAAIVTGCAGLVGLLLLLFSSPLSRLGQPQVVLPSPEALCSQMTKLAAALEPFEGARPRTALMVAALGTVRMPTRSLRASMRSLAARIDAPVAEVPKDRVGVATELLNAANQCLVWSSTTEMADLAKRNFTRAMAQLSDTVFCHSAADCSVLGKACDAYTQVCLDWGRPYCDNHSDCAGDLTCDSARHRCGGDLGCTTPNDCKPDRACDRRTGKCVSQAEIAAKKEACVVPDAKPNSPCQVGVVGVDPARWVQCIQTGSAGPEVCDGIDNDCNGSTDEGYQRGGACNEGACRAMGSWRCTDGKEVCDQPSPQGEVCDQKDNDCNGVIDDVPPQGPCQAAAQGVCRNGTAYCNGRCVPGSPSGEVCDCQDNDCDGIVDQAGVCGERGIWDQNSDANNRELTRSPRVPTDLIDTMGIAGPANCGEDEHGRPYIRTHADLSVTSSNGATCENMGWVSSDPHNCQINVHFKTRKMGSNVWCSGSWFGTVAGRCTR